MKKGKLCRILFGGDTGFGETWHKSLEKAGKGNILVKNGYRRMMTGFAPLMKRQNQIIANLETPLVNPGSKTRLKPIPGKRYTNQGDAKRGPEIWKEFGITAMSMANNHSIDYGLDGMKMTLSSLKKNGIRHFGAGYNLEEASKPLVIRSGKIEIVVAGCYWMMPKMKNVYDYYATETNHGVFGFEDQLINDVFGNLRRDHPQAILVGFPHFGNNYSWRNERQQEIARKMIRAGADIVIGHGAHKLQEVECYRDKWIIYNLGNFVYGAPGRYDKERSFPFSMICELVLYPGEKGIGEIKLYPFYCDNRKTDYISSPVSPKQMEKVLGKLVKSDKNRSKLIGKFSAGSDEGGEFISLDLQPAKKQQGNRAKPAS